MLIIMRSIPGAGKSTLAQKIKDKLESPLCYICSTDDYWKRPDGLYDFNFKLLDTAHTWNFIRVCYELRLNHDVIVDNTNTTWKEFSKYVMFAKEHGHEVFLAEPETDWKFDAQKCFEKNTHGVPLESIQKMLDRWENSATICKTHDLRYFDVNYNYNF